MYGLRHKYIRKEDQQFNFKMDKMQNKNYKEIIKTLPKNYL